MLARENRFHGHRSVARVRGKRVNAVGFTVFSAHNPKREDYRMAVVVSKKVAKSAVTRNRIRRRFYESVRKQKVLSLRPVDAVFVIKDVELAKIDSSELDKRIAQACQKVAN